MTFSVCIDIGGTFTDCVVDGGDGDGEARIFKSRSTPDAFECGFIDSLRVAAEGYGLTLDAFLADIDSIVHGTTVATNALVEGKVARVGFIATQGFPDILTLREGPRKRAFEWKLDFPAPMVPRNRTVTVGGRIDSAGNEITALNEAQVREGIEYLRVMQVEAVAVCLLWSIVNGDHELRVREIIRQCWPQLPVTLSHELNPIPREYRRASAAVIDASLFPIVSAYVDVLTRALRDVGYTGPLLMANCTGGMMPPEEISAKPIYAVMSGPTLAPIAAQYLSDEPDIIVGDMGGTTFDVSAIRGGSLIVTPEAMVGHDMLGIPKVDVRSIGAGGGSIAHIDAGGLLRVGPHSAGAVPGPACYGQGGTEATVTDANVVLGIIDPDYFLGGRIKLDRSAAQRAMEPLAATLGIAVMDAAYAIHTVSNHNMITAIEDITIGEGINPRDSFLICGGGATACHIGEMADVLGIAKVLVPRLCAGLSAYGGLVSDIRWGETATLHTDSGDFAIDKVNALFEALRERGTTFLNRAEVPDDRRHFEYVCQGRYEYQSWEIEVPFELTDDRLSSADVDRLVAAFHAMHERIYTIKDERDLVEFTTWRVHAVGRNSRAARHVPVSALPSTGASASPKSMRSVYIHALGGLSEIPVYEGRLLPANTRVLGPAVLEEETFTGLLLSGQTADIDDAGNYLITTNAATA
jgi:N-methylhydantoinase A